ncbi:hypothetical protein Tco_1500178 [Tanacetum coccineum]
MEDLKDGHPWFDVVGTFNGIVLPQYHCGDDTDGCLCLLEGSNNETDFDLWVMNKGKGVEDIWSKRRSFTLSLGCTSYGDDV